MKKLNKILYSIVNKELKEIFRDRMCVILFLLPILIFPILNLGISYISSATITKSSAVKIAVIKEENNSVLDNYLNHDCPFNIEISKTDTPLALLNNNEIDLIIKAFSHNQISFIYKSTNCSSLLSAAKIGEDFEKYTLNSQKAVYPELITCSLINEAGQATDIAATISTIMSPILFIILLTQGSTIFANDLFAGEKERKTLEILFLTGASREKIYFGKLISLFIIELINITSCIISYLLSHLLTNNSSNIPLVFSDSTNIIVSLILSVLSIVTFSVTSSAFISLISKNFKSAQKANEIFSSLPTLLTGIIMFGTFSLNKNLFSFIPIINIIKIFTNAVYLKSNILDTVIAVTVNCIFCSIIVLISVRYFKSEKALQK